MLFSQGTIMLEKKKRTESVWDNLERNTTWARKASSASTLRGHQRSRCRKACQLSPHLQHMLLLHLSKHQLAKMFSPCPPDPAKVAPTNKVRFGGWGEWSIFLFISTDTYPCVCSSDFRGLSTAMGVLCLVWGNSAWPTVFSGHKAFGERVGSRVYGLRCQSFLIIFISFLNTKKDRNIYAGFLVGCFVFFCDS